MGEPLAFGMAGGLLLMVFDLIVIGTGFASSFFLSRYLELGPKNARVLVLERGKDVSHSQQVADRIEFGDRSTTGEHFEKVGMSGKDWNFSLGMGGSSNCWWGNTPRFIPADFQTASLFGVGRDWPFQYDAIEPYYAEAEAIIAVSGSGEGYRFHRSREYTLPPHSLSDPEKKLQQAYPTAFFPMPTARASRATSTRNRCCANDVCSLCPVNAKFTVQNGLGHVYADKRVELQSEAMVSSLEVTGGRLTGVQYKRGGKDVRAQGELIALGANAIFNPVILANSGMEHPLLGRRLHEQLGVAGYAYLDGMDSFQGSTSVSGIGYMLWDDEERRKSFAPALLETRSVGLFRAEPRRWRQVLPIRLVYEDVPSEANRVYPSRNDPDRPVVEFIDYSGYTKRSADRAMADLTKILSPLPVERIELNPVATESHIQGTTVMGVDPKDSIVDPFCVHHQYRNLLVLGSSVFPSCSPANPTLTLSALSLRAADKLMA